MPVGAQDERYAGIALLRVLGVPWAQISAEIGLSRGRCQNLTGEPWWPELLAWAAQQIRRTHLVPEVMGRIIRCLRKLPLDSMLGLEYTRLALAAADFHGPRKLDTSAAPNVSVQVLAGVPRLSTEDLQLALEKLRAGR